MSKGNFFNICVLSQCVLYWIHFRINILLQIKKHYFTQFICFKIIETLQCILDPDLMKQAEKVKFSTVFKGELEPPFSEGTPPPSKANVPPLSEGHPNWCKYIVRSTLKWMCYISYYPKSIENIINITLFTSRLNSVFTTDTFFD